MGTIEEMEGTAGEYARRETSGRMGVGTVRGGDDRPRGDNGCDGAAEGEAVSVVDAVRPVGRKLFDWRELYVKSGDDRLKTVVGILADSRDRQSTRYGMLTGEEEQALMLAIVELDIARIQEQEAKASRELAQVKRELKRWVAPELEDKEEAAAAGML